MPFLRCLFAQARYDDKREQRSTRKAGNKKTTKRLRKLGERYKKDSNVNQRKYQMPRLYIDDVEEILLSDYTG